jgi:hypothetical protein
MQATYFDSDSQISEISDKARLGQVDQYAEFVHKKIKSTRDPALITGNVLRKKKLMKKGDFNINAKTVTGAENASSEEYNYLIKKMNGDRISASPNHGSLVDLLKQKYGKHPTTYAGFSCFFLIFLTPERRVTRK